MLAALFLALQAAPQVESWAEPFLVAERQLASGKLTAARQGFESSLSAAPEHLPSRWGLACVAAREGKVDEAFHHLERVEVGGGAEPALLRWDPDLATLRMGLRYGARSGERRWIHVPLSGGWLLYDDHGHVDGEARSFREFQVEMEYFDRSRSDARGIRLDAKRIRALAGRAVLAPHPQGQGPREVWKRPAEHTLRVPKDCNTYWIEVCSDSE